MWEMSLEVSLPIKIHNEIELSPKCFSWCKSKVILSLLLLVPGKLVACHFLYFLGFFQYCVYLGREPKFIKAGTCAHTCIQNNNKNKLYQKLPTILFFGSFFSLHLYSTLLQSQINPKTSNLLTLLCHAAPILASVTRRGPLKGERERKASGRWEVPGFPRSLIKIAD